MNSDALSMEIGVLALQYSLGVKKMSDVIIVESTHNADVDASIYSHHQVKRMIQGIVLCQHQPIFVLAGLQRIWSSQCAATQFWIPCGSKLRRLDCGP